MQPILACVVQKRPFKVMLGEVVIVDPRIIACVL